jgi:hypothetical protein
MLAGMRAAGLDVDELCAATGLSEATLARRSDPLPLDELVPLWRLATRQFGRGTVGLYVGSAHPPRGTLLEYIAAASPGLRAGLGQIARYIGLVSRNIR